MLYALPLDRTNLNTLCFCARTTVLLNFSSRECLGQLKNGRHLKPWKTHFGSRRQQCQVILASKLSRTDYDSLYRVFVFLIFALVPDYVTEHWQEEAFYGYQFLNGINPNVIKRCSMLPSNFPVTNTMVKPFLVKGTTLKREIEVRTLYHQYKLTSNREILGNDCHWSTERKHIHMRLQEDGGNTHTYPRWKTSVRGFWFLLVLCEPSKETAANCNTGMSQIW